MTRFIPLLVAAVLFVPATASSAVTCEIRPLPFDTDQIGELSAADCPSTPQRTATSDYWTFDVNAGDRIVVTMRRLTMADPYLIIVDAANNWVTNGDDIAGTMDARAEFIAYKAGQYRAIASTFVRDPGTDYGTYTIRIERITVPTAPYFYGATPVGNQVTLSWDPPWYGAPITAYTIEVGSTSGATDLGIFWVGPVTKIIASAGAGTYYVRIRAHNAYGAGRASYESRVIVGGEAPTAPSALNASVQGRNVTLTWLAPFYGTVNHYEIVVGSAAGLSDIGVFPVPAMTSVTVPNVGPGSYYARIRAVNAYGRSPESNEILVMVF